MTEDGIEASRSSGTDEVIEGGHQPALDIDSNDLVAEPIPVGRLTGRKVYDLDKFAGFVRNVANQHLNGTLRRDDALSMIASVATYRQLIHEN